MPNIRGKEFKTVGILNVNYLMEKLVLGDQTRIKKEVEKDGAQIAWNPKYKKSKIIIKMTIVIKLIIALV